MVINDSVSLCNVHVFQKVSSCFSKFSVFVWKWDPAKWDPAKQIPDKLKVALLRSRVVILLFDLLTFLRILNSMILRWLQPRLP